MSTNIPKQLNVPPMPQIRFGDIKADVTIDNLITILEICKQEVGGEELVLFREKNGDVYLPTYPIITIENSYNPTDGKLLCNRIFIEVDKE